MRWSTIEIEPMMTQFAEQLVPRMLFRIHVQEELSDVGRKVLGHASWLLSAQATDAKGHSV